MIRTAGIAAIVAISCATVVSGCKEKLPGAAPASSTELPTGAVPVASAAPLPAIPVVPPPAIPAGNVAPLSFAPIAHMADASVVTITTIGEEIEASPFFGRARRRETKGLGTGFVIDKDGIVLTNNHVVEGAGSINVRLSDDRDFPGKVMGTDPRTDMAVVRIDAHGLAPLSLGDSDAIEVGDWVVAIGNPFGLSHTVSAGIISAKGRSKEVQLEPTGYYNFLQTDASINPGNSGGPLLNLHGEVVGINTAIRGGGAQGIGFAIPINMVKQLLPMLLRDGKVTRSALGVTIVDVRDLPADFKTEHHLVSATGAILNYVVPGGPADKAGLQPGDIIVGFEGSAVDRGTQLQWLASTAGVGKNVSLRVEREGKLFDLKVSLGALPEQPPQPQQHSFGGQ